MYSIAYLIPLAGPCRAFLVRVNLDAVVSVDVTYRVAEDVLDSYGDSSLVDFLLVSPLRKVNYYPGPGDDSSDISLFHDSITFVILSLIDISIREQDKVELS